MASVLTFTSAAVRCPYLPGRLSRTRYEVDLMLDPDGYMQRLIEGWRRFGVAVFRPSCPSCSMCQSLRVPVVTFRPNQSQRRTWKRNAGAVTLRVGTPIVSPERLELWAKFHQHGRETKGWPDTAGSNPGLLLDNPFPTEEWTYYLGERLIGVGYVDALAEGLSAIYFFHDPAEHHRSLGTLNILMMIDAARDRGVPHVYLGYCVEGCASLEYKARFRPNEVLGEAGWRPFVR